MLVISLLTLLLILLILLQELPFVLIGIGVDDMFIITATFDDTDAVSTYCYTNIINKYLVSDNASVLTTLHCGSLFTLCDMHWYNSRCLLLSAWRKH
jgi:Sterol-sensing domain of SREBP cleavage-activation